MIKDIRPIRCLEYDQTTKLFSYEYKIIDDDFEWVGAGCRGRLSAIMGAVINCYYEKKLSIVPNVIKAMLMFKEKYDCLSIKDQIIWNKQYCPNWHFVEKDIEKYLSLI